MPDTPTPWTSDGRYVMRGRTAIGLAFFNPDILPLSEAEATARLWAAAPDLLAALRWAFPHCPDCPQRDEIRALIALATGT